LHTWPHHCRPSRALIYKLRLKAAWPLRNTANQ
jgi:hypothetical protein